MRETSLDMLSKILVFASIAEAGTGLALIVDPALVISLLLGVAASHEGTALGRFLGVALFALGLACWPGRQNAAYGAPAVRGMLIYNMAVAPYLACLGTVGDLDGFLLWPAVLLHTGVAGMIGWAWRKRIKATSN